MAGRRLGSRIGGGCRLCRGGFLGTSTEKCLKTLGGASPRRTPASRSVLRARREVDYISNDASGIEDVAGLVRCAVERPLRRLP